MNEKTIVIVALVASVAVITAGSTYLLYWEKEAGGAAYVNPEYTCDVDVNRPNDGATGITIDDFGVSFYAERSPSGLTDIDVNLWKGDSGGTFGEVIYSAVNAEEFNSGDCSVDFSDSYFEENEEYWWSVDIWNWNYDRSRWELIYSTQKFAFDTYSNEEPVADANGPYDVGKGESFNLDGSGSYDPDGSIDGYAWDVDGDGEYEFWDVDPRLHFDSKGTFTVELKVWDNDDYDDTDTATVTVSSSNNPPNADAGGSYSATIGETVALDASGSSDSDGTVESWEWDLDNDGIYDKNGEVIYVSFSNANDYTVKLKVTDDDGAADTDTATVSISDDNGTDDDGTNGDHGDVSGDNTSIILGLLLVSAIGMLGFIYYRERKED